MSRDKLPEVILKVIRDPYVSCGECMFLGISLQQVHKYHIELNYCNLFNTELRVSKDLTVEPCNFCSELSD